MRWHLKPAVMWESWFHSLMRLIYYWGTSKFQSLFWGKSTKSLVTYLVLCNFCGSLTLKIKIISNAFLLFTLLDRSNYAITRDLLTYGFSHDKLNVCQQCVFRNGRRDAHVTSIVTFQTVNPDNTFPFFPSTAVLFKICRCFCQWMFSVMEVEENTRLKNVYRAVAIMLTNTEGKDCICLKAL